MVAADSLATGDASARKARPERSDVRAAAAAGGQYSTRYTEGRVRNLRRAVGAFPRPMPDGEVGPRSHWISRVHYQVLAAHPELEVPGTPAPRRSGVERLNPRNEFRPLAVQGPRRGGSGCGSAIRAGGSASRATRSIPTSCSRRCARGACWRAISASRSRCRWSTARCRRACFRS